MKPVANWNPSYKNTSRRLKIAVLDANFYWTTQLFSACHDFADILLLRPLDFRTFQQKYGSYFIDKQPQPIGINVWEQRICCPPGWLFNYWLISRHFFAYLIAQFQKDNPLIFVFNYPYYYDLSQSLNAYSVYYSIDDYSEYWLGRKEQTHLVEQKAVFSANMTLCVANYRAHQLKNIYPEQADKITYLPHGCTLDFMVNQPLNQPKPLPELLQNYSRPIVGYVGTLTYRFDFPYLAQVAKQLPEVTFLLGGEPPQPADGSSDWWLGVEKIGKLNNVQFIGFVPHTCLGEYLQSFNVLLMCYSLCRFNLNACPTKLWDYMGTSLPIVANNTVPEVNQWQDVIHIARSPNNFAAKIKFALANPLWQSEKRLEIAKAHTWKSQAQKLRNLWVSNWQQSI